MSDRRRSGPNNRIFWSYQDHVCAMDSSIRVELQRLRPEEVFHVQLGFMRRLRQIAVAGMRGNHDLAAIRNRNLHVYKNSIGPTCEYLVGQSNYIELSGDALHLEILQWLKRGRTSEDLVRRRNFEGARDLSRLRLYFLKEVSWSLAGYPLSPWAAGLDDESWQIRVNDFPSSTCTR